MFPKHTNNIFILFWVNWGTLHMVLEQKVTALGLNRATLVS
jgi:hypothetical protein